MRDHATARHRCHFWRHCLLWLLVAVLPWQGTTTLAAAVQGQRHLHVPADMRDGAFSALRSLRELLTPEPRARLYEHARQSTPVPMEIPRRFFVTSSAGSHVDHLALHRAGVPHRHDAGEGGVVLLGEPAADDAGGSPGAAPVGLAWLPSGWHLPRLEPRRFPPAAVTAWRSHSPRRAFRPPSLA